ncbi:hypothetical protein G5V59_04400 [Nocardioides sp. W3-2-3]|uniref:hypothetical protein n=1 Tax=Nocardioides convexus TaxID=2712224 RepID=UPI0024186DAF|nr:hypothetical protein [Nocardioides convexus]NGZ99813.1 hypothetical protein [Nocardioides convexus]
MLTSWVNRSGGDYVTGSVAVTGSPFHPVDAAGEAVRSLYVLGIPTEGCRWFMQVGSGRPGPWGSFTRDADAIAGDMLAGVRPVRGPCRQAVRRAGRAVSAGGSSYWDARDTPAHHEFRAARDLLLRHRTDHERVHREFRWPRPQHFNWALEWFDVIAAGNDLGALALHDVEGGQVGRYTYREACPRCRTRWPAGWPTRACAGDSGSCCSSGSDWCRG